MPRRHDQTPISAADLYCDIAEEAPASWRQYIPGLLVAGLASMAAAYLSDHYGAPVTLMALLIGLAMSIFSADKPLLPGLRFASRTLLRVGIVHVSARVTLSQIAHLVEHQLDVQPKITIRPGARVRVLVSRDLVSEPWPDQPR